MRDKLLWVVGGLPAAELLSRGRGADSAALLFDAEAVRAWREQERAAEAVEMAAGTCSRRVEAAGRCSEAARRTLGQGTAATAMKGAAPLFFSRGRKEMKAGVVLQYFEIPGA